MHYFQLQLEYYLHQQAFSPIIEHNMTEKIILFSSNRHKRTTPHPSTFIFTKIANWPWTKVFHLKAIAIIWTNIYDIQKKRVHHSSPSLTRAFQSISTSKLSFVRPTACALMIVLPLKEYCKVVFPQLSILLDGNCHANHTCLHIDVSILKQ